LQEGGKKNLLMPTRRKRCPRRQSFSPYEIHHPVGEEKSVLFRRQGALKRDRKRSSLYDMRRMGSDLVMVTLVGRPRRFLWASTHSVEKKEKLVLIRHPFRVSHLKAGRKALEKKKRGLASRESEKKIEVLYLTEEEEREPERIILGNSCKRKGKSSIWQ